MSIHDTPKPTVGSISHGTGRMEDLLPALADALERYDGHPGLPDEARDIAEQLESGATMSNGSVPRDLNEMAAEVYGELEKALNEVAPALCYFGAHVGDGSDIGFWPRDIEEACGDGDACKIGAGASDVAIALRCERRGVQYCYAVSDHGNVTLHELCDEEAENASVREVWSIV